MKYLIMSDLHGSAPAMEKLEEIFLKERCDRILCLGDVLYHGPRNDLPDGYAPKRVIELLKPYAGRMTWVRGNCDAEVDEMVLGIRFVERKKLRICNRNVILTHGHHLSRFEPSDRLHEGDIVLYGHYHVFDISLIGGVTYINIGSPSIPKDGIAQYALLDQGLLEVRSMEGTLLGSYRL